MSLSMKGIRISAYAPADSYRWRLRSQRRARIRRALLRSDAGYWLLVALAAAITTFVCWQVG